jgi:hypothetical protein
MSTAIGGGAFLLLAKSVQNSSEFGRLQLWILGIDVCGVIALTGLLSTDVVDNGPATTLEQSMLAAEDTGAAKEYALVRRRNGYHRALVDEGAGKQSQGLRGNALSMLIVRCFIGRRHDDSRSIHSCAAKYGEPSTVSHLNAQRRYRVHTLDF